MIGFACPGCARNFNVPDSYAGRQARCACGNVIVVPAAAPRPPVAVAPPPPAVAPKPVGLRARRLVADEAEMRATFADNPLIRLVEAHGSPPERYVFEVAVRSFVSGSAASPPTCGSSHRVEVELTNDYPRVGPRCRMLTPSFHPNIDASAICIGDHWAAGERLSDLVIRIAEMLAFQAYNIRSPLNATAAMWVDLNPHALPTDTRDLRALVNR
jgi:ubiquitin-protein ligase